MPNITPEGKRRLAVIHYLVSELARTYPGGLNLTDLSHETGIPRTNLHKWLKKEVNPREATYQAAVKALEELLEERKGLPQGTVQNGSAELQRASQPVFTNKHDPNLPVFILTKSEIRIFVTVLAGFSLGSLLTLFFLML